MSILLILLFTGLIGVGLYDLAQGFVAADGAIVDRVKGAFRHSATIFVSQVSLVALGVPVVAGQVAGLLGDPTIMQAVSALVPADYAVYLPATVAVLAGLARLRSIER